MVGGKPAQELASVPAGVPGAPAFGPGRGQVLESGGQHRLGLPAVGGAQRQRGPEPGAELCGPVRRWPALGCEASCSSARIQRSTGSGWSAARMTRRAIPPLQR